MMIRLVEKLSSARARSRQTCAPIQRDPHSPDTPSPSPSLPRLFFSANPQQKSRILSFSQFFFLYEITRE